VLKSSPEFWLKAQMAVDLSQAAQELKDERHRRKSA
jgi:plasmid maintenance system antidote protein VapI